MMSSVREVLAMKIKELEALTGIPRATIRYYEMEGLLQPSREENGYREYSEDDREKLLKIKLLRLLSVPLETIRQLETGDLDMTAVMQAQIRKLQLDESNIRSSERVCREICDDRAVFATLDAARYIASFDRGIPNDNSEQELYRQDAVSRVAAPWRRFFARVFDLSLCSLPINFCLVVFYNVNLGSLGTGLRILHSFAAMLLMLMAEPLLLHLFGTTPGKWILGLSVSDENGRRLSYGEGWMRTFRACAYGMGLSLPIISLIRLLVSRKACLRGDVLAWEEDSVLELRDEKSWRVFAYAALDITVMVLELLISIHFGMMPRNRGDITVAEFSENYNRLAAYYKFDFGADLDEEGRWVMRDRNTESITIFFMENYLPEYEYTFEDGRLKDIRFHYETDTDHPSDCSAHMQLALLSFGFTDRDLNVVNNAGRIMKETVSRSPFKSFHYSAGGVTVDCQVNYEGYWSSYPLMPKEDLAERHYSMVFSISKD